MAVLLLQVPAVQDYLRRQGEQYLQNKLHTKVRIGYLRARSWKYLELRNVYVADTARQALLYSGSLKVHYNLLALLNNELRVNKLEWDTLLVNAYRQGQDTTFNFQFIIDAFVSPDTTPDTLAPETGTTMQFHIKDVALRQIKLRYIDEPEGLSAVLQWDTLLVDPDDLLVNEGVYAFRGITLSGLTGFFRQAYRPKATPAAAPPPAAADTVAAPFHLLLKKLLVANSAFQYQREDIGISTTWKIGSLQVENINIDQDSTRIQTGDISIRHTQGALVLSAARDTTPPAPAPDSPTGGTWRVATTQALLEQLTFRYDNNTAPAPRGAGSDPDYNHLLLQDFNTRISDISYRGDTLNALLHHLRLRDRSGFAVKQAHMFLTYTPQTISLQDLLLETNRSVLRRHIVITVPSWSTVANHLDQLEIRANLDSTRIALGEWLPFVPDARTNTAMQPLWNKQLTIDAILKGSLGHLNIQRLYIADNAGNKVQAHGEIFHAASPDSIRANLPRLMLQSGDQALRAWLPAGTLPDTPRLPRQMLLTGSLRGGLADLQTKLQLQSDMANVMLNAHLVNITDSVRSSYSVDVPSFHVHPGQLLYDTTMGWINGRLQAEGKGYELSSMTANAMIQLYDAAYNGYTYRDISAEAGIRQGRFEASGSSGDTALSLTFDLAGRLQDTLLENLQASLQLSKADLYATHWYAAPLQLKGNLDATFSSLAPTRPEGEALLTGWQIATEGQVFPLDTIALRTYWQNQQYLTLDGPFGSILASGYTDYTKLGAAFSGLINKPLQPVDSNRLTTLPPGQQLQWTASLRWPHSLQAMAPSLRMTQPLMLQGRMNTDSSLLTMTMALPAISYDSLHIDSLLLDARIQDTSLNAALSLAALRHPVAPLYHTQLLVNANAGNLSWDLDADDANRRPKYKVGGLVRFLADSLIALSLKPGLLLNKQEWTVDENNIIRLRNGLPDTASLQLSSRDQSIRLHTQADTGSTMPALQAGIRNFQLATITGLLAADTMLATGVLNAQARISNLDNSPLVDATLRIDSLYFRNTSIGTLEAALQTPAPASYQVKASLSGNDNDLQVQGVYDTAINATVDINRLSMKTLEPFTFGNMTRMHGSASGQFTINGTTSRPQVKGSLHFNEAGGTITYIGTPLTLPNEDIVIDDRGILLNNLVIADSLKNELVVNGRINTRDFTDYRFNLDVNAENFMVLGKQQHRDQMIYGPAFVDSRIKVRGNLDLPRIDAYVKLRDKSSVTFTIPQDEPGVANREGVIVFVDKDQPLDSSLVAAQDSTRYENPRLTGMVFSGNAEITPLSTIKIIIDQQNGDYVEAKGTANLNATLDPSSKLSLTGRYEIQEGKYQMSLYEVIKRAFAIEKGSYISFNGDVMSAELDITAKYTVHAPAVDLVQDQLSGMSDIERNRYKQRLPFEVYMQIKGDLLKPDISFRLDMPEAERNAFSGSVYNRIKQINQITSELNKQVMGLLVLNSFIPDDPTATSGGGVDVGREARKSVSKILSQQLNNLAGDLIKGVDINFDLESNEDYSTGTARESTTLGVNVSKSLFSDRLTVSVGSDVALEGDVPAGKASTLVGDVSIEYKLTADGRYRIRVYQRNANETVVQGQVVETGAAFMIVMDYDHFREILRSSKKEKQREKLRNKNNDK